MNIKELRLKHRLSQQDLANKTGIPRPRIAKWEEGKGRPKQADYEVLAKFFAEAGEEVPRETTEQKKPDYSAGSIFNLTESNRMMAESNRELVQIISGRFKDLEIIKLSLNSVPDSLNLLTDLILKGQDTVVERIVKQVFPRKAAHTSVSNASHKKSSRTQKRLGSH